MKSVFLAALFVVPLLSSAQTALPLSFNDAQQQQRYQELLAELRCLVCQNQSLADSNAELAQDLRHEVHRLVSDGAEDSEVVEFLVARYGDFVLYRPPLKIRTYLLWFGPGLLLLIGAVVALRLLRRQASTNTAPSLSADEQRRAMALLADTLPGNQQ